MKNIKIKEKVKKEKCVSCGCDTGVPFSQPIEEREYYVHGCGQLCQACYDMFEVKWYKKK